jgi:hypothetical protein
MRAPLASAKVIADKKVRNFSKLLSEEKMNSLSVHSNKPAGLALSRYSTVRKVFLACGIVSSLLYVVTTILGAMAWPGYSTFSQSVSELMAFDAPSAALVFPLFFTYSILIYAFGVGVWMSAGQKRALRMVAILIVVKEVLGLAGLLVGRMHMRGIEPTWTDYMHLIITGVGVLLCMFPAMGFAAAEFGKTFRFYTFGTMLIFLVFGFLAGSQGAAVPANLPTPWLGFYERINIFGYLLWVVILAFCLLPDQLQNKNSK